MASSSLSTTNGDHHGKTGKPTKAIVPAGMESEDESVADEEIFVTPREHPRKTVNWHVNGGGKMENGQHKAAVDNDDGGGGKVVEKMFPDDDLEGIFLDNGIPVDERIKLNSDQPTEESSSLSGGFNFKKINETLQERDEESDGNNGVEIARHVEFQEAVNNGGGGEGDQVTIGGKRRRVEIDESVWSGLGFAQISSSNKSSTNKTTHGGTQMHGFDAFRFKDESSPHGEDLETVLCAAKLGQYVPQFRAQGVGLAEFLITDESDFEKLGVEEMGERKRLVQLVHDIHAKPWAEKSLIHPGPDFSVAEAVKMISNIHGHLVCMEASLIHLRRVVEKKELAPSHKPNFRKLMRELNATSDSVPLFQKRLRELGTSLRGMAGELINGDGPVDAIDDQTKAKSAKMDVLKKGGLVLGASVAVYFVCRKFFKN